MEKHFRKIFYFPEMLFSGKENNFMCLAVTKFILRKINFGVWFLQTFLQKMLYMPNFPHNSSTVNIQIINNFTIIHRKSKTQQKNSSNPVKLRSRGGGEDEIARWRRHRAEARSVRSSDKRARRTRNARRSRCSLDDSIDLASARCCLHRAISSSPPPRDLNLIGFDEFFCWVLFLLWMSVELIHFLLLGFVSFAGFDAFSVKMFEWTKHRN